MEKQRRSIRLKDYDYRHTGVYFITICVHQKRCLFGDIKDGVMTCNEYGMIVLEESEQTPVLRPYVELDLCVVMPNHFHGLMIIDKSPTEIPPTSQTLKPASLGAIMGQFKSAVTRRFQQLKDVPEFPIWQRNYYEHIVRNADDLGPIQSYIELNPLNWQQDTFFLEK